MKLIKSVVSSKSKIYYWEGVHIVQIKTNKTKHKSKISPRFEENKLMVLEHLEEIGDYTYNCSTFNPSLSTLSFLLIYVIIIKSNGNVVIVYTASTNLFGLLLLQSSSVLFSLFLLEILVPQSCLLDFEVAEKISCWWCLRRSIVDVEGGWKRLLDSWFTGRCLVVVVLGKVWLWLFMGFL